MKRILLILVLFFVTCNSVSALTKAEEQKVNEKLVNEQIKYYCTPDNMSWRTGENVYCVSLMQLKAQYETVKLLTKLNNRLY